MGKGHLMTRNCVCQAVALLFGLRRSRPALAYRAGRCRGQTTTPRQRAVGCTQESRARYQRPRGGTWSRRGAREAVRRGE